jgi:transposase
VLDETGLMLQPLVRRTWAPAGQTPVMYSWDRHDRLSALGALSVSPQRRRLGLYFSAQEGNLRAPDVATFLRQVHRQIRRPLIVVLDRWNAHRTAARQLWADGSNRFWFEWLPAYAPELNPVDKMWSHTKYGDLANYIPEDLGALEGAFVDSLWDTQSQPELLRSFFHAAQLPI